MIIRSVFIVGFVLVFLYYAVFQPVPVEMFDQQQQQQQQAGGCTESCVANTNSNKKGCTACGTSDNNLLPVMNPYFNMREICKQSILLEDHLFQKRKRCQDCVRKHLLTIEALAEELVTLDKSGECKAYYDLPDKIRAIEKEYLRGVEPCDLAQKLRAVRKELVAKCFDKF